MTFPCYPKYKASGLIWLGDVPESWSLKRLGHYFDERRERASDTEFEPLSVTKHGIVPRLESAAKTQDGDNRKKVLAGDFVINSRSDRKGSSGLSPLDGSVSLICTVLIPTGLHGPFIHHLFRSVLFQEEYYRWGKGIVADLWSTNFSDMKNIVLGVPSATEQTQIARFLDHETARIDALIEEQQRLIELLKEKRQAVISQAVTKGLYPNKPMNDSGVEWLGEVPAHWETVALKWRARIKSGDGISPLLIESDASTEKFIPVIGGNGVMGYTNQCNITPPLLVIGRVGALCGNVHEIYEPAWVSDNALILNVQRELLDLTYLSHVLRVRNLNNIADKSAQPLITGSKVISQYLPCPSLDEQMAIATFIRSELDKFDELILAGAYGITLLQERRSALISAAVTGKIDVRGWQPPASASSPESTQEAV